MTPCTSELDPKFREMTDHRARAYREDLPVNVVLGRLERGDYELRRVEVRR